MARGRVSPESFTNGSSAQRVEWFERGLANGEISSAIHLPRDKVCVARDLNKTSPGTICEVVVQA